MKNTKIKGFILITLVIVLLIVGVIGMIFFNKTESGRVPKDGFYPISNYSYYAFTSSEQPFVCLDVFFVNNHISSDIGAAKKYSDFQLVSTENDVVVDFKLTDEDISYFQNKELIFPDSVDNLFEKTIKIDLVNINRNINKINFNQIRYKDIQGQYETKDFGSIMVEFNVNNGDRVEACSNRIIFKSFVQPTFDQVYYTFDNFMSTPIQITNIYLGETGVVPDISYPIVLEPNNYTEVTYKVKLMNEKIDEPMYYVLKPKFEYEINGEKKMGVFDNTQTEKYISTDIDINEYLYLNSK